MSPKLTYRNGAETNRKTSDENEKAHATRESKHEAEVLENANTAQKKCYLK